MSAKPPSPPEITQLLAQWNAGDKLAFESLFPLLPVAGVLIEF